MSPVCVLVCRWKLPHRLQLAGDCGTAPEPHSSARRPRTCWDVSCAPKKSEITKETLIKTLNFPLAYIHDDISAAVWIKNTVLTGCNQTATDCPALFNLDVLIVLDYLRLQAVLPKVLGMLEFKPQIDSPGSEGSWGFQIWIYPPAPFTLSVRHFSVIVSPVNTPCELLVVRTFVLHLACPQILWRYERFSAWSQDLCLYRAVFPFTVAEACAVYSYCSVSVLSVEAGIKGHQPQEKTDQQTAKE